MRKNPSVQRQNSSLFQAKCMSTCSGGVCAVYEACALKLMRRCLSMGSSLALASISASMSSGSGMAVWASWAFSVTGTISSSFSRTGSSCSGKSEQATSIIPLTMPRTAKVPPTRLKSVLESVRREWKESTELRLGIAVLGRGLELEILYATETVAAQVSRCGARTLQRQAQPINRVSERVTERVTKCFKDQTFPLHWAKRQLPSDPLYFKLREINLLRNS